MSLDLPELASKSVNLDATITMSPEGFQKLVGSTDGKNIHWTCDISRELPIKMANSGAAQEI